MDWAFGRRIGLAITIVFAGCAISQAADYPTRPITLVVPIAAGGNADVTARAYGKVLSEELGQSVVIENKPGAGSSIGASYVANARPDGYTLLFIGGGTINKTFIKDLRIEMLKDLTPVIQLAKGDFFFVVTSDLGVKTMPEFIELVKKAPNKYNASMVSPNQLMLLETLKQKAKIDLTLITYKAAAEMHQGMLRADVVAMMDALSTVRQHLDAGKFKALMVASRTRSSFMPDLPSAVEVGYPDVQAFYTYGVWAPANTPNDIVMRLNQALSKAQRHPTIKALSDQFAFELLLDGTPQQMRQAVADEQKFWAETAERVGYKAP